MKLGKRWDAYWFSPAPLFNLAVCRILIVGHMLSYLLASADAQLLRCASLPNSLYDPLPILRVLSLGCRPSLGVLDGVYWATVAAGFFALIGLRTSVSLLLFALGNIFLRSFLYSFFELHHNWGMFVLALAVMAFAPSGEVLSWDAFRDKSTSRKLTAASPFARWPLQLIGWLLALSYFSACLCKLQSGGLNWLNGFTLQFFILKESLVREMPLGLWLAKHMTLVRIASWIAAVFEGTFWVALVYPRTSWIYVIAAVGFHLGAGSMMHAPFYEFILLLCAVFVPWDRIVDHFPRRRMK